MARMSGGDAMRAGTAHRPWPVPARPWALAMQWHGLLFMHWPVQPAVLRPLIPPPLQIDTFDGAAWIGVVPFHITGFRPHYVPALPWVSAFPELNVRTYVTLEGKPGIWFFSLDAANPLAVRGARVAFHLPYYDARMVFARDNSGVRYASRRTHRGAPPYGILGAGSASTWTHPRRPACAWRSTERLAPRNRQTDERSPEGASAPGAARAAAPLQRWRGPDLRWGG